MVQKKTFPPVKSGLHPRNLHRSRYDFPDLIASHPPLKSFVTTNAYGDESIDFADPSAVKTLNSALLAHFYSIPNWDIPSGYLCPPIPGRADYLHNMADLLAEGNNGEIPRGDAIRVLDIGVGANAIYPTLGRAIYGWQFVGTDIDTVALENATDIFSKNACLAGGLETRLQPTREDILHNIVRNDEHFNFTLCNPPFHASAAEATAGSQRKRRNLRNDTTENPLLNFGGQNSELWCEGGELHFVLQMILQSQPLAHNCQWFSTLVSKQDNLPSVYAALKRVGAANVRTLNMAQGQKVSRIVAWCF